MQGGASAVPEAPLALIVTKIFPNRGPGAASITDHLPFLVQYGLKAQSVC
jgi:hypothetical protein